VILGSLASKLKRTGKIAKTDFAIVLTVANGEIVRFQNRVVPGPSRPTRAGERIARGAVFREGQVTVDFAVVGRWSLPGAMLLLGALSRFPGVGLMHAFGSLKSAGRVVGHAAYTESSRGCITSGRIVAPVQGGRRPSGGSTGN
jgi:hypothetical protein